MIIAFQIILLVILIISFIGAIGEVDSKLLRNDMTALCIASMIAFIVSALWL